MKHKKIKALLIAAVLLFSLMPAGLNARAEENVYLVYDADAFRSAWNSACSEDGTIILQNDIIITEEFGTPASVVSVTVNLNGHKILGDRSSADSCPLYMFRVRNDSSLTIIGNEDAPDEYIKVVCEADDSKYQAVIAIDGGKLIMNDVVIRGNADPDCDVVLVRNDGTFFMDGGAILDNTGSGAGSAVIIEDGYFELNGGTISGNSCYGNGAGVWVGDTEIFVMNGGTISGNRTLASGGMAVPGNGGAIFSRGFVTVNGGTISGNSAYLGGAIYAQDPGLSGDLKINIKDAEISENTAVSKGGAICAVTAEYTGSFYDIFITLENTDFEENEAGLGGAIYIDDTVLNSVKNCTFTDNDAVERTGISGSGCGGVLWADGSSKFMNFEGCTFESNSAEIRGGVMYLDDGYMTLKDCVMTENTSTMGAAMYLAEYFDELRLKGTTRMTENTSSLAGGAILVEDDTKIYIGGKTYVAGNKNYYTSDLIFEDDITLLDPDDKKISLITDDADDPLDVSFESHAWVGIGGAQQSGEYNIAVNNAGVDRTRVLFSTYGMEFCYGNDGKAYASDTFTDMTSVNVNGNALVTKQGDILSQNEYVVETDPVNCTMHITTESDISLGLDTAALIVPAVTTGKDYSITRLSFDHFTDPADDEHYSFVYLVSSSINTTAVGTGSKKSREVYWYVEVEKISPYIAQVGDVQYKTMEKAQAASVQSGENGGARKPIILLADVHYATKDREETMDVLLNGHSITFDWSDLQNNHYNPIASVHDGVTTYSVPYIYAKSVSTKGELVVNFYVSIDETVDLGTIGFRFDYYGPGAEPCFIPAAGMTPQTNGYYRVSFAVPAKEMGESIGLCVTNAENDPRVFYSRCAYSVEEYYRGRLNLSTDPVMRNLSAAALNYGAAAQTYFGYRADPHLLVNYDMERLYAGQYDLSAFAAPALRQDSWNAFSETGSVYGFWFEGQTVVFKSEFAIRFYFDGDAPENYTFTLDDGTVLEPKYNQDRMMWFVEIPHISARNIDEVYALTVTKGEESITRTYSVLTYIYNMYYYDYYNNDAESGIRPLLEALYTYYLAAEAWAETR